MVLRVMVVPKIHIKFGPSTHVLKRLKYQILWYTKKHNLKEDALLIYWSFGMWKTIISRKFDTSMFYWDSKNCIRDESFDSCSEEAKNAKYFEIPKKKTQFKRRSSVDFLALRDFKNHNLIFFYNSKNFIRDTKTKHNLKEGWCFEIQKTIT